MCASSDGTGVTHGVQKLLLIRARMLTRQLDFDIQGFSIRNAVPPDISFAVVSHVYDSAVLGVELTYRVVPGDAAVLTEGYDNLVL